MPELTLNISPPPPPTLVLDISPPQGPEGPQGNTGPQGPEGPQGETGPQPDLSTNTPGSLGVAAAGVSMEASRSDHVHAMPSAADVGALPVELIGLTPEQTERGAWDENETYTLGDVVFFGGFWVGVAPVVGSQPGDVSGEWDMFITSTHIGVGTDIGGIGGYSTAVGVFSHASGNSSTALGIFVEASGEGSTALGAGAVASGEGDVNLANIITGHIDTSTFAADALTLPTGFADLPHTDASSNPNVDSSRLIARSDGLAVRDEVGAESKLILATDPRLTDARIPLAHTHGQSDVTGLVADMAAKQPLDSDLTAIAALSTTAFGRSLLELVDAVGGRAALSAAAATHVHDGADITSGVVAPARLGSGVADASKVLRGDGVWGLPTFSYVRDAMPGREYGVSGVASGENGRLFRTYVQRWWGAIMFLPAGYYDRITVRTTVAGNQTANIGIYPCGPSGSPIPMSAPIANGGVMDFSGPPGLIHAGISLTLPEPAAVFAVMSATTFTTAATLGSVSTYGSAYVIPPLIGLPVTPSSTTVTGGPLYGGGDSLSLPGATAGVDVAPSTIDYGDYSIPWMRVRAA